MKKDRLTRDLRATLINQGVFNHWWSFVQAVEAIRADGKIKIAIFRLGGCCETQCFPDNVARWRRLAQHLTEAAKEKA